MEKLNFNKVEYEKLNNDYRYIFLGWDTFLHAYEYYLVELKICLKDDPCISRPPPPNY